MYKLQIDSVFVVAYEIDVKNEQSASDKVVNKYYKLHYKFYYPHVSAEHIVAEPTAERRYAKSDSGKYQKFNKPALVLADVAVLKYENGRQYIVYEYGEHKAYYRRRDVHRYLRGIRCATCRRARKHAPKPVVIFIAVSI